MYPDPITPKAHPDLLQRTDYDPFAMMPAPSAARPRVFTTAAQLARARQRVVDGNPVDVACLARLVAQCPLDDKLPDTIPEGDPDGLLGKLQAAALNHALAWHLTGEEAHRERAVAALRLVAPAWLKALEAADGYGGRSMQGFAAAYDLLAADGLDAEDDNLFRDTLFAFPGVLDRMPHTGCNNHNVHTMGARFDAGLALGNRQIMHDALYGCQRAGVWRYGFAHLLRHDFLADGMHWEGSLSYHAVVLGATCRILNSLANAGVDLWQRPLPALVKDDGFDEHRGYGPRGPKSIQAAFDAYLFRAMPNGDYSILHDQVMGNLRCAWCWGNSFAYAWEAWHEPRHAWLLQLFQNAYPPDAGDPPVPLWFRNDLSGFIRFEARDLPAGHFSYADDTTFGQSGRHEGGCSLFPAYGSAILRAVPERRDSPGASLYFGPHWAGHRSPAALHLEVNDGARRITHAPHIYHGAYSDPRHLGWNRSTIAHNTVSIDEAAMFPFDFETDSPWECDIWRDSLSDSRLEAFSGHGACKCVRAVNDNVYPGVVLDRSLALDADLLVDVFRVRAERERTLDWAVHCHGTVARPADAVPIQFGDAPGYRYLTDGWRHPQSAGLVRLPLGIDGSATELLLWLPAGAELLVARDPVPDDRRPAGDIPNPEPRQAIIVRVCATAADFVAVWSFGGAVEAEANEADGEIRVVTRGPAERQWCFPAAGAPDTSALGGDALRPAEL
jgi:hypothetical protein